MSSRVIVLTMGRVGSSSVARALEAALDAPIPHLHSVDPFKVSKQVVRAGSPGKAPRSVRQALKFLRQSVTSTARLRVVSLVREPIDRNISAAFTSLRKSRNRQLREAVDDSDALIQLWKEFDDRRPFQWFQDEIEGVLGVRVFDGEPIQHGFGRWSTPDVDLLVLRSDLPREMQEAELASFVGQESMRIETKNTENRSLPEYKAFKRNLRFDCDYVSRCWQSDYMQQFFPDISLESYLEKWARP